MKAFKNIVAVIIFLSINGIQAKRTGGASQVPVAQPTTRPVYTPQPQVQPKPQPQIQPSKQAQTFPQLVDYVKKSNVATVWDNGNKLLKQTFVADVMQKAKAANLDANQFDILLEIARDAHAQFTGNQNQDIAILEGIEKQMVAARQTFIKLAF